MAKLSKNPVLASLALLSDVCVSLVELDEALQARRIDHWSAIDALRLLDRSRPVLPLAALFHSLAVEVTKLRSGEKP